LSIGCYLFPDEIPNGVPVLSRECRRSAVTQAEKGFQEEKRLREKGGRLWRVLRNERDFPKQEAGCPER